MGKSINFVLVFLYLTLKNGENAKGDDDFATKTVSMKNVAGKSSGLNTLA